MSELKNNLVLTEKYDEFVQYVYSRAINMSRKHHVLRDEFLRLIFAQYGLFADAAKSNQVSKLYAADAGLAHIRVLLRFLSDPEIKLLSRRQRQQEQMVSLAALAARVSSSSKNSTTKEFPCF